MNFDTDKFLKNLQERRQVKCPKCGDATDDAWELGEAGLVTYWGEETVEYECPNCGAKLLINEEVTREYEVKAVESFYAVQITNKDGKTQLYEESWLHQKAEDCNYLVRRLEEYKKVDGWWKDNLEKIEVIQVDAASNEDV